MKAATVGRSLALVCCLAACGTTVQYTPTNAPPRPMRARPPGTVELFTSSKPDRPFVEVGILEAQQSSKYSTDRMPEIIAELRKEAAKIGCDAIMMTGAADQVTGDEKVTTTLKGYRGTCIMWKTRPKPPVAPVTPPT
jgi:hypothetical protein